MEVFGILWNEVIMRPMINSLAFLSDVLFDNFGLSIIVFTVLVRFVLIPLTMRQTNQMRKMQTIQPRMKILQEKYKGKSREDKRALSSETMKLYREAGVSPVGCLGPLIIQMPIWIGLYRAILQAMPSTPEKMADLANAFYIWNPSMKNVPIDSMFLGIDLVDFVQAAIFPINYVLPVVVGASMWLQQKMTTGNQKNVDPRQAQTNQIMLWMMPIMFGFFTFQFPAGLAVYILFSNIVGILIQYYVGGRQPVVILGKAYLGSTQARAELLDEAQDSTPIKDVDTENEIQSVGKDSDEQPPNVHREDRGRSNRRRTRGSRRRTRRRRN